VATSRILAAMFSETSRGSSANFAAGHGPESWTGWLNLENAPRALHVDLARHLTVVSSP